MIRKSVVAVSVAILACAAAPPAGAITFGQPDNGAHPNVGALIANTRGTGELRPFCSGTLISPTVVVTAGHCTDALAGLGIAEHDVWVTFSDDARSTNASRVLLRGTWHTDPNYGYSGQGGRSDPHELGVVVLDAAVSGRTAATLPRRNELSGTSLKGSRYIAVGYGQLRLDKTGGPNNLLPSGVRYWAEQGFLSLQKAWLQLDMNPSTGSGGTCFGDSGGPHFAKSTGKLVAVTITGDSVCRATDTTYRLDTDSARSFLDDYVTLP